MSSDLDSRDVSVGVTISSDLDCRDGFVGFVTISSDLDCRDGFVGFVTVGVEARQDQDCAHETARSR
jgi:hypothetical protein